MTDVILFIAFELYIPRLIPLQLNIIGKVTMKLRLHFVKIETMGQLLSVKYTSHPRLLKFLFTDLGMLIFVT